MNLNKDKWSFSKLGNLTWIKGGKRLPKGKTLVNYKTNYPYLRVTDFEKNSINTESLLYLLEEDYHKIKNYTISKDDVFISIAGTIGIIGIIPEILDGSNLTENAAKLVIKDKNILNQYYLLSVLLSPTLQSEIKNNTATTAQPKLGLNKIFNLTILLPPFKEQQQIASLFQSIETAMEQVEMLVMNLLRLKKNLLRDLFSGRQRFGNYLLDTDFETVHFDKIANNISERVEPKNTALTIYVGLEHLDADNLKIERTGIPDDVIGTKLKIYKGDIIFGKRRAYLRKLAVSHFDGIASAHSMILRANEKNIEKEFLPYFMQSDAFMSRAVQISEGSLSPTIKNKTLAQQEFIIPKKKKQKELITVFKQFDLTMELLKQQKTTLKNLKQKLLNEILG